MIRATINLYLIYFLLVFLHCDRQETIALKLKLIPWDSPESPLYPGNLTTLEKHQRFIRYSHHLKPLSSDSPNEASLNPNKVQIPVSYQFRYCVSIKIGNPSKMVRLLLHTGNIFIWTHCTNQLNTYNPTKSRSYKPLPCNHPLCLKQVCQCVKNQCNCRTGQQPNGVNVTVALGLDTLRVPLSNQSEITLPETAFGCSTQPPFNFSGVLGIDRSPVSLLGQLRGQIRWRLSYCLWTGPSYLTLGEDIPNPPEGKQVKITPLIRTKYSAFYVKMVDISVAGKKLGLPTNLFSSRNKDVLMDTGVRHTILEKGVYDRVNKAFAAYLKGKLARKRLVKEYGFEPCYEMKPGFKDFPTMTFHFQGKADLVVERTHIDFIGGLACAVVAKGSRTVIGAEEQQGTRLMFDVDANVMKFYSDKNCGN